MHQFLGSIFHIAIIDLLILILYFFRMINIRVNYLLILNLVFLLSAFLLTFGLHMQSGSLLQWNWLGKLLSILFGLLVILYIKKYRSELPLSQLGFTIRQSARSVIWVSVVFGVYMAIGVFGSTLSMPKNTVETLLFQATMPGIDEELFYRGILLFLLSRGAYSKSVRFLGARWDIACLLIIILFGLIHGLTYEKGELNLNTGYALGTAITGTLFLWSRLITGSLLLPVIVHNLFNVIVQFIE